jgi:murein DD-endopeptidase MepM/ murein hydrolase activator NlpD
MIMTTQQKPHPETINVAAAIEPVWPLPKLNGHAPVILVHDEHDPGVELAYERRDEVEGPMVRSTKGALNPLYLPPLTPVFSVFNGRVLYAGRHLTGYKVIVEHSNGWMSYYANLEQMFVVPTDQIGRRPPQQTKAGHILGYAGSMSLGPPRPVRFELWKYDEEYGYISIDPIRFMRRWRLMSWMQSVPSDPPETLTVS